MQDNQNLPEKEEFTQQKKALSKFFENREIVDHFISNLTQMPSGTYALQPAYQCIYLQLNIQKYRIFLNESKSQQLNGRQKASQGQSTKEQSIQTTLQPINNTFKQTKERKSSIQSKTKQQTSKISSKSKQQIESKFLLKIGKSYPVGSVRLYLVDGRFQPKIYDSRDLLEEAIGSSYSFKTTFLQIISALPEFEDKLMQKNQKFLEMQRTGRFRLKDIFYQDQLAEFGSLTLFHHKKDKISVFVGVTETHLLTFKEIKAKKSHSRLQQSHSLIDSHIKLDNLDVNEERQATFRKLMLVQWCDLQCVDLVSYKKQQRQIQVTFKKYRSIKLYYQSQATTRVYSFAQNQIFLRCLFKYIGKFQPTEVFFCPQTPRLSKSLSNEEQQALKVFQKVQECSQLEQKWKLQQRNFMSSDIKGFSDQRKTDAEQKKEESSNSRPIPKQSESRQKLMEQLNRAYQKLIEYYSARASPYYLIYVNKLNSLYLNVYKIKN